MTGLCKKHLWITLTSLIIVIAIGRIRVCHFTYSPVIDEGPTLAAGIEFLDRRTYRLETLHPPLGRLLGSIGPYVYGLRNAGKNDVWSEGAELLKSKPGRQTILPLARLGNLLPFTIVSIVVATWAYLCGGKSASILSVLLFTSLPPILGHASIATLDLSCASFTMTALFSLFVWLERPTFARSALLGTTTGLALLSKFSAIGFLAVGGASFVGAFLSSSSWRRSQSALERLRMSFVAVLVCGFSIWVGYGGSFHTLRPLNPHSIECLNRIVGKEGILHNFSQTFIDTVPIPAPEFVDGLLQLEGREEEGHLNFMLGEVRSHGWWYFYPLRLLIKTPIAFLILTGIGWAFVMRSCWKGDENWQCLLLPILGALATLNVGMQSEINNGLRQLLVIYPLLAITAGTGCARLWIWSTRSQLQRGAAIILVAWQIISAARSFPEDLSYFNEFVGNHAERFAADSDIDWGQDVDRMTTSLKRLGANDVGISVRTGMMNLKEFDLPRWHDLSVNSGADRWVAISVHHLKLGTRQPPYNQHKWLEQYTPVERVGKSIMIYDILTSQTSKTE